MTEEQLKLNSKGALLNDATCRVDHVNYSVYAKAIAQRIEEATPPITIGIFDRWGAGKSSILKHIRDLLERKQRENKSKTRKKCGKFYKTKYFQILTMLVFTGLFSVSFLWTTFPTMFLNATPQNSTSTETAPACIITPQNSTNITNKPICITTPQSSASAMPEPVSFMTHYSRYIAMIFLFLCIATACLMSCCNFTLTSARLRLILYATFSKFPTRQTKPAIIREYNSGFVNGSKASSDKASSTDRNKTKYIFVEFNAWEYAGSDTLWAGIVTNLSKSIEAELGTVTSRLFRWLTVAEMESKDENGKKIKVKLSGKDPDDQSKKELKAIMGKYGVVKKSKIIQKKKSEYWYLFTYSLSKEAKHAFQSLQKRGINVEFIQKPEKHANHKKPENNNPPNQAPNTGQEGDEKSKQCCPLVRHISRHPKTTCGLPNLYWSSCFVFSIIFAVVATILLASNFGLDIFRIGRAVPAVVQIMAWLPPGIAVLFVILKVAWAMFHSQRRRIHAALKGTEGNVVAQLGFMNKVKKEVEVMTQLVKCAEFTHGRRYRIVIFIDDLDRVDHTKVESILKAINILLSDDSSRFICLIAVDSRVAVRSIEASMTNSLVKRHVNGHEYLKKIINLPLCLPEVSTSIKNQYISGMLTLIDETKTEPTSSQDIASEGETSESETDSSLKHEDFIKECKKHFRDNELLREYLDGNLRNMKRVFNILSFTLWIIHYQEEEHRNELLLKKKFAKLRKVDFCSNDADKPTQRTKLFARNLVTWIVLIDQWPYRMSYLLQVIDDKKKPVKDNRSLSDIYEERVLPKIKQLDDKESLKSIDLGRKAFKVFLERLKDDENTNLNAKEARLLKRITFNLDQSWKQTIQYERAMATK